MKFLAFFRESFFLVTLGVSIFSVDGQTSERQRPFFRASRALAMGDAYSAYNVGYEAVYYNPAGVAKRHQPQAKFLDIELQGSSAMYSYFKSSISNIGSLGQIASNVAANPGQVHSVGLSFLPQFIVRNFSIGLVAQTYSEAIVLTATDELDFYAFTDVAIYSQFAVAFWGGVVKLGVGAKILNRAELERTYSEAEYTSGGLNFSDQWQEGLGYGLDVGLLVTIPTPLLPTFGLVVQDVGNTTLQAQRILFTGPNGRSGAPPALKQRVNIASGINVKHSPGVKSGLNAEVKDVVNISDDYLERIHLGWELSVQNAVSVRAGFNQGRYWTAGFGFKLGGLLLEFATYGENLLHGTGSRRDDRKWVGRYVMQF